jgi:23S rRNA (uracil1939-C5)-methyltransferase
LTIDGEEVEAQIVEQKHKFDRAELRNVLRSSVERVEPLCPYFGRCGGCDYQHIAYKHQLELKQSQVSELVKRVGHLREVPVSPVIPCRNPYEFRNRITVHAEQGRIGFFAKNSRNVVDVERCAIAVPAVNEKLKQLRKVGLRDGSHRTLREEGLSLTFAQTNNFVASELLEYISTRLEGAVLLDAYCGSGFFAHAFAGRFQKIIGLDWNEHAIASAKAVAETNEQYICANVADAIPIILAEHKPQTVIFDPPADGIEKRVANALAATRPGRLIYVSCNPATLARDLSRLRGCFEVKTIQPFDMFPQAAEIETVVVLEPR